MAFPLSISSEVRLPLDVAGGAGADVALARLRRALAEEHRATADRRWSDGFEFRRENQFTWNNRTPLAAVDAGAVRARAADRALVVRYELSLAAHAAGTALPALLLGAIAAGWWAEGSALRWSAAGALAAAALWLGAQALGWWRAARAFPRIVRAAVAAGGDSAVRPTAPAPAS